MAETNQDPLRAFFDVREEQLGGAQPFDGGEHLWVGNAGALKAATKRKAGPFGPFQRSKSPEHLTYGEIVAFSGDFYGSPEELFDETPSPLPWLREANDLDDLLKALRNEAAWINLPPAQRGTQYPDQNLVLWWNAKQYSELALQNTPHFGWHNALVYARHHEAALKLAVQAAQEPSRAKQELLWRQAVYTNGFADHFLTDGFSAGHVRAPAAQIRRWAEQAGMNKKLAGVLIKVIHDQDGHIHELHSKADHSARTGGLHVVNALKQEWHTRCDGQLFLTGPADASVETAVEAVADSVEELLSAYQEQKIPQGVFAATRRLPWPHPDEPALITKFPADIDRVKVEALYDSIRWYLLLPVLGANARPEHIEKCCAHLPQLMEDFRDDVTKQVAKEPALIARLAPEYVAAYQAIR
ncbi:hypothetical protein D7X96_24155 [Corallococcus interemptor]|uniref:Phospholipase n=1 Tax=Corallococcus interemptor TaxID=2316720 RepID=A0A3A8QPR6_9BACT|nr:hypothetical protein [Corallococcus interemptor]RKH65214.1 hypothetical protein D7X96_24155 [Corallococcus interemptor]